jgi:hypothetical protein
MALGSSTSLTHVTTGTVQLGFRVVICILNSFAHSVLRIISLAHSGSGVRVIEWSIDGGSRGGADELFKVEGQGLPLTGEGL